MQVATSTHEEATCVIICFDSNEPRCSDALCISSGPDVLPSLRRALRGRDLIGCPQKHSFIAPHRGGTFMNKAEKNPFVFPSDDFSEDEDMKQVLLSAGFSEADREWLVQVFKRPDCFGDSSSATVFRADFTDNFEYVLPSIVEKLSDPVQTEKDRQTRLALLFSFLLGFGPRFSEVVRPKELNNSSSQLGWVGEFQSHAKFCAQSLDWDKLIELKDSSSVMFLFDDLVPFLFPEGVPLNQIVNLDRLDPIQCSGWGSNDFRDPEQLEFWLIWRFYANAERCDTIRLDTLLLPFSAFPENTLGKKILGLLNALHYAMGAIPRSLVRLDPLNDGWQVVAHELIPFLDLLTEQEPDSYQERSAILKAWWYLAKVIYGWSMGGLEAELSPELRDRLVESAAKHIGILRSILRDTPKVFEEENSTGAVSDFYKEAFYILLTLASPWKRLKTLLLAFTEMTEQAVTSDLRPWPESGREAPPHPYSLIPLWIGVALYPQNLRNEMDRDPYLQALREELAKFCLERLKTKGKQKASSGDKQFSDKDFVEPRPLWRQGYVQTLAALRVNPGGRAHRTLFWLSQNDPNEEVCALAKRAHKQIRHLDRKKPNLDEGASPRRPLFEAFWWLRQAHLLHLGITPDPAGAMRTRRRELHRTREKDDNWGRTR